MISALTNANYLNIQEVRQYFPILNRQVNGHRLIYLDNAATTQKPISVINALTQYYQDYNANIHRGNHALAEQATSAFEETREAARTFINAKSTEEIIFVKGVTEAINLVASTFGRKYIKEGDEIIISSLEHHSNIVPWQWLCKERKAKLKVIPISDSGDIEMNAFRRMLSSKTKLVAVNHASNALGTVNPIKEIINVAHAAGALVLIDGAQTAAHLPIDVQNLDCDFYCFSAHKMYGPTGTGILYGKKEILEAMPPYQRGGEMIREVSFDETSYNDLPYKFEAGTPNIADVIAFRHAMEFIRQLGKENILMHEQELLAHATDMLTAIPSVRIVGTAKSKVGVVSFLVEGVHVYDIGFLLDARGIAVRTGHHCTQPLMARLGLDGTVRASFGIYNTIEEITVFANELSGIVKICNK